MPKGIQTLDGETTHQRSLSRESLLGFGIGLVAYLKCGKFPQDDYRKQCEPIVRYLVVPFYGKSFSVPGVMLEARFMAGALYLLNMERLSPHLELDARESSNIETEAILMSLFNCSYFIPSALALWPRRTI